MKSSKILFVLLLLCPQLGRSQSSPKHILRVNQDFDGIKTEVDAEYPLVSTAFLSNAKVVILAHDFSPGLTDIKLYLLNSDGTESWARTIDNNNEEYGIDVRVDGSDNIYVLATGFDPADEQDVLLYKYDKDGNQTWSLQWDAGNSLGDYPTRFVLDGSGNVYITGIANRGNESTTSDDDVFTLKVTSGGQVSWSSIYDYNGNDDVGIDILEDGSSVYVAANSESSSTIRNRIILKYAIATGAGESTKRVSSGGNEYWTRMKCVNNNLIITGRKHKSTDYDAVLESFKKSDLTSNWETTYDGQEKNDVGMDLESNNGHWISWSVQVDDSRGEKLLYNLFLEDDGTLDRTHIIEDPSATGIVEINEIEKCNDLFAHLINRGDGTTSHSYILFYNEDMFTIRKFVLKEGLHGIRMAFSDPNLCVSGWIDDNGTTKAAYQKIEIAEFKNSIEVDTNDNGDTLQHYYDNLISVVFDPSVMNLTAANNLGKEFGSLGDFIDTTYADTLSDSTGISLDSLRIYKTYPWMTANDTVDTNQFGKQFRLFDYYSVLNFQLPDGTDMKDFQDGLLKGHNGVMHFEKRIIPINFNHSQYPNDGDLWNRMFSHHSNPNHAAWNPPGLDFSEADINILDAWKMVDGDPKVKVGLVEVGGLIHLTHEDFSLNKRIDKSVVVGGYYDDVINIPAGKHPLADASREDFRSHATNMGGHIGALRNNKKGVAGTAGGAGSNIFSSTPSWDGVSMYSYLSEPGYVLRAAAFDRCHISNHAYGSYIFYAGFSDNYKVESELNKAEFQDAYNLGHVMVAGRGNKGDDERFFPACYPDPYILSIGASGRDGKYRKEKNSKENANEQAFGSYGRDMDLLAPGASDITRTTEGVQKFYLNANNEKVFYVDRSNTNSYLYGNTSSSASAITAGVAALIIEHQFDDANNRSTLYPEDVEHILELGATDLKNDVYDDVNPNPDPDPEKNRPMPTVGYDDLTGWGRLDARRSLSYLKSPDYQIIHFEKGDQNITSVTYKTYSSQGSNQPYEENITTRLSKHINNVVSLNGKYYQADVWRVDIEVEYDLPSGYVTHQLSSYSEGGVWPINSLSNLMAYPEEQMDFYAPGGMGGRSNNVAKKALRLERTDVDKAANSATFSGYVYHFTGEQERLSDATFDPVDFWYPFNVSSLSSDVEFGFTVHAVKSTVGVEKARTFEFSVYPNPTNGMVTLRLFENYGDVDYTIFDITGKQVLSGRFPENSHFATLDMSYLPTGIYTVRLESEERISTSKIEKL